MKWGSWAQVWLWWLVIGALLVLGWRVYQQANLLKLFRRAQLQNFSTIKNWLKLSLWVVALLGLGIAALAPQLVGPGQIVAQRGRSVIIALDVSRSMLVSDLTPNRLTLAKQKIKRLIALLDAERVGLILFSKTAFVQCPLTRDRAALYMFLDDVDAASLSAGGTALAAAVQQALAMLPDQSASASRPNSTTSLVIFTDGEDFSPDLAAAKQAAQAQHLALFTVGVASVAGGPVPVLDQQGRQTGHQLDQQGQVVISRLNEQVLRFLAQGGTGLYTRVSAADDQDLRQIKAEIEKSERQTFGEKQEGRIELYPYLAVLSLVCLLLEWLL